MQTPVSVLFVCLGNICRSPTAHGIFEQQVQDAALHHKIKVDSCGTGDWHIGHSPDRRSTQAAAKKGYQLDALRARQVQPNDFHEFNYILAMDQQNLADLQRLKPASYAGELDLFLTFSNPSASVIEVPDPYYGESDGFAEVINLVEDASVNLLTKLRQQHGF
jgi:protein-tyrosine phosphatase